MTCVCYVTDNIGPSSGLKKSSGSIGTGKKTVRLRSNGPATVEDVSGHNMGQYGPIWANMAGLVDISY